MEGVNAHVEYFKGCGAKKRRATRLSEYDRDDHLCAINPNQSLANVIFSGPVISKPEWHFADRANTQFVQQVPWQNGVTCTGVHQSFHRA